MSKKKKPSKIQQVFVLCTACGDKRCVEDIVVSESGIFSHDFFKSSVTRSIGQEDCQNCKWYLNKILDEHGSGAKEWVMKVIASKSAEFAELQAKVQELEWNVKDLTSTVEKLRND